MIRFYCKNNHDKDIQCEVCRNLLDYAKKRLELCRYGERKKNCNKCAAKCYSKEYKERIREVMRYAGPRMIFARPFESIRHIFGF